MDEAAKDALEALLESLIRSAIGQRRLMVRIIEGNAIHGYVASGFATDAGGTLYIDAEIERRLPSPAEIAAKLGVS